jgi:murein DD-endopeptidase MepM/ murein hydrolase activator NlpD
MSRNHIFVWTILGIGLLSACSHIGPKPEGLVQLDEPENRQMSFATLESSEVSQGGVAVIRLNAKDIKPEELHIFWNDREIPHFSQNDKSGTRMALLGIPMGAKPGPSHIEVKTQGEKYLVTESLDFLIKEREMTSERIRVRRKFTPRRGKRLISLQHIQTQPSPLSLHARTSWSPEPLWQEGFTLPVSGHVTSEFGSCRVFNGRLQTMHNGTDFQAKTGDPVHSAAGGRVVLAKRLFLTGKTVIVDHGLGIFTTYAHLSKLLVKKGALIGDQTLIGLAGSTGRASGSHLHLSAKVNGVKVDPLELIRALGNEGNSKPTPGPAS